MATFLDALFTNQEDALRRDLNGATTRAVGDSMRITNAAAARGAASPTALASASARAGDTQRAAMAGQQAAMLTQARLADQNRAGQVVGTLLDKLGSIGGTMLGIPGGDQVGSAVAGGLGRALASPFGASQAPQPAAAPTQAPLTNTGDYGNVQTSTPMLAAGVPAPVPNAPMRDPSVLAERQPPSLPTLGGLQPLPQPGPISTPPLEEAPVQAPQAPPAPAAPQPPPAPQAQPPVVLETVPDFQLPPLQPLRLPRLSTQADVLPGVPTPPVDPTRLAERDGFRTSAPTLLEQFYRRGTR